MACSHSPRGRSHRRPPDRARGTDRAAGRPPLQLAQITAPPGYRTLAWVGAGFVLFALGFALRARAYRWSGFAALALAASRLIAVDVRRFSPGQRILTFVLAGVALLVVSFVYARRDGRS